MTTAHSTQARARPYNRICMRSALQMYAWCVLSVSTAACGPSWDYQPDAEALGQFEDDPRAESEIATDIYATEHAAVTAKCASIARNTEFVPMDSASIGLVCNAKTGTVQACFDQYDVHGALIAIDADYVGNRQLRVHELLHVLIACAADDAYQADSSHSDAVWNHIDGVRTGRPSGQPR